MLTGCGEQKQQKQEKMQVGVAAPKLETITEWHEYSGRFAALDSVDVQARVSGYLDKVLFTDGQYVSKGDTLFIIDQRPYQIAFNRAKAAYELAKKELDRAQVLKDKNVASAQTFDQRQEEFSQAEADFNDAKLNLDFTEVKSPLDGRIGRHLISQGNLIVGGTATESPTLATIVSQAPIYFYIEASESEYLKYLRQTGINTKGSTKEQGVKVYVKLLDEDEFTHEGTIDFVDNQIDKNSGTIQLRAVFENENLMLKSGLFGRMRVPSGLPQKVMLVPDHIIGSNQTDKFVYVVGAKGTIEVRPITTGPLHNRQWRVVRSGLNEHDQVVFSRICCCAP